MNETMIAMDINNSSIDELCLVPGLGRAMAERVIAYRPFNGVDDLMNVPGIGGRLLERIRPYLCVTPPLGVEMVPAAADAALAEPEPESLEEPVNILLAPLPEEPQAEAEPLEPALFLEGTVGAPMEQLEPLPSPDGHGDTLPPFVNVAREVAPPAQSVLAGAPVAVPAPAAVVDSKPKSESRLGRIEVLAYVLIGSFLALALGVLITLGVLRAINGDLVYATASRFNGLQSEVVTVSGQVTSLQSDVAGMRQRVEALEALGGRVSVVEREAQSLRTDLAAAESQLAALETETQALAAQTETLAAQTEQLDARTSELEQRTTVFQSFLDGLRSLLLGLPAVDAK